MSMCKCVCVSASRVRLSGAMGDVSIHKAHVTEMGKAQKEKRPGFAPGWSGNPRRESVTHDESATVDVGSRRRRRGHFAERPWFSS